jgi:arylsulfatase A-like enzyme
MYLLRTIAARAAERLLHIFFIRDMDNTITAVHDPAARISDEERVEIILDTMDNADRPVFIFTHMMDTHGPDFYSEQYTFSPGDSSKKWDVSNYLDAILSFDSHVKSIYEHLDQTGKLDNTILIIYTDHGFEYTIDERIPVFIRFPHDEFSGTLQNNVQVIDIPVTLLDYLGISQPEWMTGISLLKGEPPQDRLLFATTSGDPAKIAPPFYQINILQGIACDRWYRLDVRKKTFRFGSLSSHTAPCLSHPPHDEVYQSLLEYLERHGYNTQSLR